MSDTFFILVLPLLACIASVLAHVAALRFFPRLKLLDFPERYGLSRARLPYPTGILSIGIFLLFFLFLEPSSLQKWGLIVAVILLGGFSFFDDRSPLPSLLRLLVHILTAIIIFATGTRIYTLTNPLDMFGSDFFNLDMVDIVVPFFGPLPIISGLFTLVWLGLTINALNWFDGIPGQVSLLATIGFLTLGCLSLSDRVDQPALALLSFLLGGISLAALFFDFPPPKVLMGDSGAMFFGLMLGVLTIYSGGKVATAFLALGVPLIDLVIVSVRRIMKGKSIAEGNATNEHLHHRLLSKGWSPRQVILLTASIGTLFGVTALFLNTFGKFIAAFVLFFLMLFLTWYSRPRLGS